MNLEAIIIPTIDSSYLYPYVLATITPSFCTTVECTSVAIKNDIVLGWADNPIQLGWEKFLDCDSEPLNVGTTVCRVNLICSQVKNSNRELTT